MATFTITPRGAFSLEESALFGFGQRHTTAYDGTMRLGFCLDGTFAPVGAALTQLPDGSVRGEGDPIARDQAARCLSLDVDATSFALIEDPVIRRLQAVAPGLRPPLFHSAYEAAAWCVLSARRPARQMQVVRERLSRERGTVLSLAGQEICVFPTPSALLQVTSFPGLDEVKLARLHGIARAALAGELDTSELRALDAAEASTRLQRLAGIGPFSAMLIVVRALGHTDVLATEEPQALALVGSLYGLAGPASVTELEEIAQAWTPWRTWALVLVRTASRRLESAA
jgi:DNA-3-methyladenine glycosylase II